MKSNITALAIFPHFHQTGIVLAGQSEAVLFICSFSRLEQRVFSPLSTLNHLVMNLKVHKRHALYSVIQMQNIVNIMLASNIF